MSSNFKPKHDKDRKRKSFKQGDKSYVVVNDTLGTFRAKSGAFGDAGDAELYTLEGAHDVAGPNSILNVANHPQLAVLFFTNR